MSKKVQNNNKEGNRSKYTTSSKVNQRVQPDEEDDKRSSSSKMQSSKVRKPDWRNRYHNDAKWYKRLPEITLPLTQNSNFLWANGTSYPMNYNVVSHGGDDWTPEPNLIIPGVAVIWTIPSFGVSKDNNSAINLAKDRIYTYMRRFNSGSTNYDPEDLMIHIAAAVSICARINELKRLYGLMRKYSSLNSYLPKAVFAALGYDYESFRSNMVNFRSELNLIIADMARTNIPAGIDYFEREAFMYSGVYTEGESIKDQLYLFAPAAYTWFNLDSDGAGMLSYASTGNYRANSNYYFNTGVGGFNTYNASVSSVSSKFVNMTDALNSLKAMMDNFFRKNDFAVMNGDIKKAWGESVMKFTFIPEDYEVPINFDLQILEQIKNATICDFLVDTTLAETASTAKFKALYQSPAKDALLTTTTYNSGNVSVDANGTFTRRFCGTVVSSGDIAVTAHASQPDEDVQLENTRLCVPLLSVNKTHEQGATTSSWVTEYAPGSDIVLEFTVLYADQNNNLRCQRFFRAMLSYNSSGIEITSLMEMAELYSRFEFLPRVDFVYKQLGSSGEMITNYQLFNYSNYAIFNKNLIAQLNKLCIQSLLYVD